MKTSNLTNLTLENKQINVFSRWQLRGSAAEKTGDGDLDLCHRAKSSKPLCKHHRATVPLCQAKSLPLCKHRQATVPLCKQPAKCKVPLCKHHRAKFSPLYKYRQAKSLPLRHQSANRSQVDRLGSGDTGVPFRIPRFYLTFPFVSILFTLFTVNPFCRNRNRTFDFGCH